jgi:molybdopterin/thiamine biosynthesis adenylyltransferase/rhodanese-related sulfurtransferase
VTAETLPPETLTTDERSRYLRHLLLGEIGEAGQLRLKRASVLCIGAGGLGSPALLYLAAAGVGRIGIADPDVVDSSNLQRQVLFDTSVVGKPKAELAAARLRALNPYIQIETFVERFDEGNAERMLSGFGAIMDGTDNFATRYLVNDVAVKQGKPNFFGCIFRFSGQLSVFTGDRGCYRCLFPAPPAPELAPDCAQAGVLGVLPGLVGTYQALEFLKWHLGIGTSLAGKLLTIETLGNQFRTLKYAKNPECACSNPSAIKLEGYQAACASDLPVTHISVAELKARIAARDLVLLDVRNAVEHDIGNIGGTLLPVDVLAQQTAETIRSLVPADRDQEIAVYCRGGARSARACQLLRGLGYTRVLNVQGGIVAWQRDIDPGVRI